jgi:hypothetical protein
VLAAPPSPRKLADVFDQRQCPRPNQLGDHVSQQIAEHPNIAAKQVIAESLHDENILQEPTC